MKRTFSFCLLLVTMTVLAAMPLSARAAAEEAPACVPEVTAGPSADSLDPAGEAAPQALCHVRADCPTGGPVSCSGSSCVALDSCYAWCDGVYHWCAPPPGIYCPPVH